jgi:hypothetical protein
LTQQLYLWFNPEVLDKPGKIWYNVYVTDNKGDNIMKVYELINALQKLPPDDEIVITALDDYFYEKDFEVHSPYDDGQAQEIIINSYFSKGEL